jgi:hypothetical protein
MLYEIRMDDEEARWIVNLFKMIQISYTAGLNTNFKDDDIERMQSFITRVRARTNRRSK